MRLFSHSILVAGLSLASVSPALAGGSGECGGVSAAPQPAPRDIVQTAIGSADHTTLVAAVKSAGLVETLQGNGPFTVFAPTNAAFGKLPAGTVDTLLQPANKATLSAVLTYHVVAGEVDAKTLIERITAGGGKATLTTVQGGKLVAMLAGKTVVLTDAKGGTARVTAADLDASNGVIHVIDGVVLPK